MSRPLVRLPHIFPLLLGTSLASSAFAWSTPATPSPTLTSCARATNSPATVQPSLTSGDTDRARIQSALDSAASTKTPVVLASGTFNLSAPLTVASGVTLCSQGGTVLKWNGTSAPQTFALQTNNASNFRIANLTFDGAGATISAGSGAIIEANTFKNIKPATLTDTQDVYGWFAIKLVSAASISIRSNVFDVIAGNGVAAWTVTGSATSLSSISGNWFGHMNQPISMVNSQYTTIDGNQGYEIERMAVELVGDQMTGTPALDHPGITVTNNRFGNWKRFDNNTCAGNSVCLSRHELIALSVVSSTGATVSNNVLDCGTGCVNADKGWGIEFSSYGTASVTRNTVRGFSLGIGSHNGQTLSIKENALFEVNTGVFSTGAGSISNLTISDNQIEASPSHFDSNAGRWGAGISPQWDHAGSVTVSNNTVAYKSDASRSPVGGEFVGIQVAQIRSGGTAGTISGNRVLFDGTPVAGFDLFGIRLAGSEGSLSGTKVTGNWIVATGGSTTTQGTGLDGGWQNNGTLGVTLSGNVFQNLSHLNRYYANHTTNGVYTASNNWAINMDGSAAPVPNGPAPVLAQSKTVTLQTIKVGAVPSTTTISNAAASFMFATSVSPTPVTFTTFAWHYGDGRVASNTSGISATYVPGATRVVRALAKDSNGALITATREITQL